MQPKNNVNILGINVVIDDIYSTGHTLNEAEALALNQKRREHIMTNLRLVAKRELAAPGADQDAVVAKLTVQFADYSTNYKFSERVETEKPDPAQVEARRIARQLLEADLRKQGINPRTVEDMDERISALIEAKPQLLETAQRRIEELRKIAEETLDLD